jgi:hypothetical protein
MTHNVYKFKSFEPDLRLILFHAKRKAWSCWVCGLDRFTMNLGSLGTDRTGGVHGNACSSGHDRNKAAKTAIVTQMDEQRLADEHRGHCIDG